MYRRWHASSQAVAGVCCFPMQSVLGAALALIQRSQARVPYSSNERRSQNQPSGPLKTALGQRT
eukprot:3107741-Alexandrium_andersonii.AAC.1